MKYKDLLKKGKELIESTLIPFKARAQEKELEMKVLKVEEQLAKDDLVIAEEKSKHPVDWDKLLTSLDNKDLNNRKLKQLKELQKELFGNE